MSRKEKILSLIGTSKKSSSLGARLSDFLDDLDYDLPDLQEIFDPESFQKNQKEKNKTTNCHCDRPCVKCGCRS